MRLIMVRASWPDIHVNKKKRRWRPSLTGED
jgi:hypothetical protein